MAKGILALIITLSLIVASAFRYLRDRSAAAVLGLLATACFVVVALAHLFEELRLFPSLGWGQPSSVGHYIDLGAAILGIVLALGALTLVILRRQPE